MEVVMHRFVLAEFNTHRAFSRNSASSRAIPVHKQIERVRNDPAIPLTWPAEQKGMQGGDEIEKVTQARLNWLEARKDAIAAAEDMVKLGVHKSIVNRLLEPYMHHTVVVTSVEWSNFFNQRCSPLAQPEIRAAAEAMRDALKNSIPVELQHLTFHKPYLDNETIDHVFEKESNPESILCKVSAARCARVSYLTQDGKRDYEEDLTLYERLVTARPAHWSPLEHVCRLATKWEALDRIPGNLAPFVQLRHIVSGEI
jgi:thymidylate synthase ThyX